MSTGAVLVSPPVTASCIRAADICASKARREKARRYMFICHAFPLPLPLPTKNRAARKCAAAPRLFFVLEDDVSVRHISVRVLRALGYEVIEAANSSDARHLLAQDGGRKVDLLLTDMVMPQVSGRRFADALRAAHPNIKVLFISGYLEESLQPDDRCEPGMFFLPKPFDAEQLALKVREALDAK